MLPINNFSQYINPEIHMTENLPANPPPALSASAVPGADLTQYINPEIHNVHPALRSNQGFSASGRKQPRPDAYKTVMCQAWLESGQCSFGTECKFAHGETELRPAKLPIRNSLKYKTKLCDKYTTTGICPYGNRCLFIHPDPRSSALYRQSAITQQLVRQTVGLPYPSSELDSNQTGMNMQGSNDEMDPRDFSPPLFGSSSHFSNSSRPHPSWPLEAPAFYGREDGRLIVEQVRRQREVGSPELQEEDLRVAARAAAAAAKKSGAALGMTEEQLAYHLARQLAQLQRSHSSSVAYENVIEEQNAKYNHTHSVPTSRRSSISPFSNASTEESSSGVWSSANHYSDSSPIDSLFSNDVFYQQDDDCQKTPKFSHRRCALTSSEVAIEVTTPCAVSESKNGDNFSLFHAEQFAQNIAKVLDL